MMFEFNKKIVNAVHEIIVSLWRFVFENELLSRMNTIPVTQCAVARALRWSTYVEKRLSAPMLYIVNANYVHIYARRRHKLHLQCRSIWPTASFRRQRWIAVTPSWRWDHLWVQDLNPQPIVVFFRLLGFNLNAQASLEPGIRISHTNNHLQWVISRIKCAHIKH